jgi:hypothetical protein
MLWDFSSNLESRLKKTLDSIFNQTCIYIGFFIHAWWESTKWISWKEFAQTGPEKVCDKVIINKLECNVMGFFFKFGKQIEENIGFNI